jgi:hypothetical protein
MIIGVDGNEANVKKRVGVSFYTYNLLWHFQKQADANTQFKVFLKNQPLPDMPEKNKYFSYDVVPGRFLWSQILTFSSLSKKGSDVFFSPAHYGPRFLNVPLSSPFMTFLISFTPMSFKKKIFISYPLDKIYGFQGNEDHCCFKHTQKRSIRVYGLPENKIAVIYNGLNNYAGETIKI